MRHIKYLLVFLCGCTASTPWQYDEIFARTEGFDSARIRYTDADDIAFEMVRVGSEVHAFLSLNRSRLPKEKEAKIVFHTENRSFEDVAFIHEGRMRVRLSTSATDNLIHALKANEKIVISLGDLEQTLDPEKFSASYDRFLGEKKLYETLLEGVF